MDRQKCDSQDHASIAALHGKNGKNQIKSNGLLGIAALMLDHNNIEVMCLQLIRLWIVLVDNTIAVTKITKKR